MSTHDTQASHGKTVLITGGARRIGAGIARLLHARGFNIVIHYLHSVDDAKNLAAELDSLRPGSTRLVCADLLATTDYPAIVEKALALNGRLDALINNASMFYPTAVGATGIDDWNAIMGTNLMAPYFLAQSCRAALAENSGCIINLTDIHGERPLHGHAVYSAAKAGLIMLTRALAVELAPEIRVNAVSPGAILWPESMSEEAQARILAGIPLARRGSEADIASAVRYLIEDAGYVTGQVLAVDGGRSLGG